MDNKTNTANYDIMNVFREVKRVADRVPADFGGGSPMSKIFLMTYVALEFNLRSYVEIGIYRGKSLFPMAYIAKMLNGKAYGIDAYDFETAKEFEVDPSVEGDVNGFLAGLDFSQIYKDVKNLQVEFGFSDHSVIIKDDSKNAVRYFQENQITIDMLHIDGNHDTPAVQADVDAYLPLVREGGFIVVDDINWESVMRVYRPLKQTYHEIFNDGYFAILIKMDAKNAELPLARPQLDAIYKLGEFTSQVEEQEIALSELKSWIEQKDAALGDLASQIEKKEAALGELRTKAAEQEHALNKLITHAEDQGKAILSLTTRLAETERRASRLIEQANIEKEHQSQLLNAQIQELREQVMVRDQHIRDLDKSIADIFHSTSWKLTLPIRAIKPLTQKVFHISRSLTAEQKEENKGYRPLETTRNKKVSVIVTSYNHEGYIAECLDSVLRQKGFFKKEIIVGDDCSTDGTAGIIERYRKSYPKLIKVMPGNTNLGITKNLKRCLDACSGDYIAICEGDDYWLDEYKLQKQIEHLESHPDYSMCFSSFLFKFEDELSPFIFQSRLKKDAITTADLIEENYIGNFSCCMYRTQTVRNLPKEIFDVFTVDWMFNMACGDQGPIGFLPEPLSVYRKHRQGTWTGKAELEQVDTVMSLLETYNNLLGGKYERDFLKRKMHLIAYKKRLLETPERSVVGENGSSDGSPVSVPQKEEAWVGDNELEIALNQTFSVDLLVLDTIFPHPLSPFRYQEFISYLDCFPSSLVLTTGEHLPAFKETRGIAEIIDIFETEHSSYAGRTIVSDHDIDRYSARLAYAMFLNNIYVFLDALEKKQIPFVFTLYPGGGFTLNVPESDAKLSRVLKSPQFRKVIVTQKITHDYLLEKHLCSPEQIEFVYGVVTPLEILRDYDDKKWYGVDKERLDICFVAHKYMKGGIDKGYDLFVESARHLASEIDQIHFHVVGDFNETDLPIDGMEDKFTFYGQRKQSWFDDFYRDKDIILSPNRPFILLPGTFDGFPTASCTEAGLRKVAIFCTDMLEMNCKFSDKQDIVIIQPDASEIVETIKYYHAHPDELRAVAENGHLRIREVYSYENQIAPRIGILESELKSKD